MRGFIGLGSNLGDRRRHLSAGLAGLLSDEIEVIGVSSVWEAEPVDSPEPLWFLNMVAEVETSLEPHELLRRLLTIESRNGRRRGQRNAPRSLDLDLLFLGDLQINDHELELPHPRMWSRRFVLEPLAELTPDRTNPLSGRTVREELQCLTGDARVIRRAGLPRPKRNPYNSTSARSGSTNEIQIDRG